MPLILGLLLMIVAIFVEIAGIIMVGSRLGVVATLMLLVAAMLAGVVLLRLQGRGLLRRISQELESDQLPDRALIEGLMMVMAGILLIIPGFVSDLMGILLFMPPVRAVLWRYMAKYVTSGVKSYTRPGSSYTYSERGRAGWKGRFEGEILDLENDEYQAQGNEKSPWHRVDNEKNRQ